MEWSKLKNIIILILLAANLFLLVMVGVQEHGSAKYREQTISDMVSVLEQNGIHLDRADVPAELDLMPMAVERDLESEASLAAALLGECDVTDLGSGRYAYQSGLGWAEFRSNGNFSFNFSDGGLTAEAGGEEAHALATMELIGFTGDLVVREENGGQVLLTLRQTWEKLPVLGCQVTLEYADGGLRSIAGQRLMGTPQPNAEKSELITAATALLRFLNGINGLGDICSEITSMTPGYRLDVSADATGLTPVWYVITDTGAYSLDALTGALERA